MVRIRPTTTDSIHYLFDSLKPVLIIPYYSGTFPVSGLKGDVSELRPLHILHRCLLCMIILCLLAYQLHFMCQPFITPVNALKTSATDQFFEIFVIVAVRIQNMSVIIHCYFRTPRFIRCLQQWRQLEYLLKEHVRYLKICGYVIVIVCYTLGVLCIFFFRDLFIMLIESNSPFCIKVFNIILSMSSISSDSNASLSAHGTFVIFYKALALSFHNINEELRETLNSNSEMSTNLYRIRMKHRQLCDIITDLNSIMSPLLEVMIFGDVLTMCVTLYNIVIYFTKDVQTMFNISIECLILIAVLGSLIIHCNAGQHLMEKVNHLITQSHHNSARTTIRAE